MYTCILTVVTGPHSGRCIRVKEIDILMICWISDISMKVLATYSLVFNPSEVDIHLYTRYLTVIHLYQNTHPQESHYSLFYGLCLTTQVLEALNILGLFFYFIIMQCLNSTGVIKNYWTPVVFSQYQWTYPQIGQL